jgi:hypothetical protein
MVRVGSEGRNAGRRPCRQARRMRVRAQSSLHCRRGSVGAWSDAGAGSRSGVKVLTHRRDRGRRKFGERGIVEANLGDTVFEATLPFRTRRAQCSKLKRGDVATLFDAGGDG